MRARLRPLSTVGRGLSFPSFATRPSASPSPPVSLDTLQQILLVAPVILVSFVAHEFAHGYVAWKQGDSTAHDLGLLNWDPRTYVDPLMTLVMPLVTFVGSGGNMILGGARSAPLNPANYRHPRLGDILVSLAGVTANLLLVALAAGLFIAAGALGRGGSGGESLGIFQAMCVRAVQLNLFLILFNLLPIPPLDGSHVVKNLLPRPLAARYARLGRYGILMLLFLVYFGGAWLEAWMRPARQAGDVLLDRLEAFQLPSTARWLQMRSDA
jgi:Zn-dependent protease